MPAAPITTVTDRDWGRTYVYRGDRGIGSVRKVNDIAISPRGRTYRTGWQARKPDGGVLGVFGTRKAAVAEVALRVTIGL